MFTANTTSAASAPRIAGSAKRRRAWAAVASALTAKRWCVTIASPNATSVSSCAVNLVLKMISVRTAKKKWRKKMKNNKHKSLQSAERQIQANLRQTQQESSLQAEKKAERPKRLALRFSPTAWAKLLYFRDKSDNEVGGFGIAEPDDLLFVKELITVKQEVTVVSVKFEDEAVADFFDTQVDLGRKPEQFARIWLHSHPGDSPEPSATDEETFERVFGNCQWAVLFVVAQDNKTYANLSFNVGPGGQVLIPTEIDYSGDFGASERELWDAEYAANIKEVEWASKRSAEEKRLTRNELCSYALPYDFLDEFEKMEPEERQFVLDELAERPELWNEEGVMTLRANSKQTKGTVVSVILFPAKGLQSAKCLLSVSAPSADRLHYN